ncbi:MAG TPA: transcription elongation factor GreA [Tissierellaceae bacterium]
MLDNHEFLTAKGLEELEKELDLLRSVKRKEVASRIKEALSFGDISENSEYDQAKNEQAQLEEKIAKIENTISNARIIDEKDLSTEKVSIGSKVVVLDLEYDEKMTYSIVGSAEADPYEGRISNVSPLGSALIDRKKGDIVEVKVPDGIVKYEILDIEM